MFAFGCLKFIKHSLQNCRLLLNEMKPSRIFWVQMICCCSTVKVSGAQQDTVWLVTLWDILSQDWETADWFLAFSLPGLKCLMPGVCPATHQGHGRTRGEVGFVPHRVLQCIDNTLPCPWKACMECWAVVIFQSVSFMAHHLELRCTL